jgi:hypothetical protein
VDLTGEGWEDVDWINLAQGRDQCRTLVNTQGSQNAGNFLTS